MMPMSVGICECGCTEFGHTVGCPDDLPEQHWGSWQKHRCDETCEPRCAIRLCKDAGDGYWTWCDTCDIECSGDYDTFSDEPDGPHDQDECDEQDCELCNPPAPPLRNPNWPPAIGTELHVNFSSEPLTVVERIITTEHGDPVRETSSTPDHHREVYAVYATDPTGRQILVQPDDL